MQRRTLVRTVIAAAVLGALPGAVHAQAWPSKPITYVVPFPPGGTTDVLARILGQKLGAALGTTIVVENKPGAGGNVGSEFVAKAAPDGYTILGGTISSHAINVSLYPKLPYDPVSSFQPITLIGSNPNILVVNASSPYKSVQDITAELKAKWTYRNNGADVLVREDSQTVSPSGPATSEFHVSKPDGWPVGDYRVDISLAGSPAASKSFTVK